MELSIIKTKIHNIQGNKVILDFDLAELYEVETRVLKQAVRRNLKRFPDDLLSSVLYSDKAIDVNISIMRAFVATATSYRL